MVVLVRPTPSTAALIFFQLLQLLTPHIAWATNEALQRLMDITTNNLRTWLDGRGENIVNA